LQAGGNALFVDIALEQQGQTLLVQLTCSCRLALQGQEPREAERERDSIRLHPRLPAQRQALFEQGTGRLQLALLQVDESQQTERMDVEGGVAPFPKVGQALLG